ncbi:MAG TPA: hypothetical protein VHO43_03915 [Ignavibacteriales bacterium]|nr:hypothetical protein [Ignavibacteriales bacterium]
MWKDDYSDIKNFSFSPGNSKILLPTVYHGLYELDPGTLGLSQILNTAHTPVASAGYSKSMAKVVCQDGFGITVLDRYGNNNIVDNILTIRRSSDSAVVKSPAFIFNDTRVIYLQRAWNWPSDIYSLRSYTLRTGTDSELISYKSIPLFGEHFEVMDGDRILCTVREDNKYYIKIIDLADNSRTVLLGEGQKFSLSPDGSKVVIYDKNNIYIINSDGTDRHLVYTELGGKVELITASLSFDGKYIVFAKTIDIRRY